MGVIFANIQSSEICEPLKGFSKIVFTVLAASHRINFSNLGLMSSGPGDLPESNPFFANLLDNQLRSISNLVTISIRSFRHKYIVLSSTKLHISGFSFKVKFY